MGTPKCDLCGGRKFKGCTACAWWYCGDCHYETPPKKKKKKDAARTRRVRKVAAGQLEIEL